LLVHCESSRCRTCPSSPCLLFASSFDV
jgi:hypothetical protein